MKKLYDRKDTTNAKALDRMVLELSKYMTEFEIDRCVSFLNTISTSKHDINWSETDAATQIKIMIGIDRYKELKTQWSKDNQHLLKQEGVGVRKFKHKRDNTLWDGLDATDIESEFEIVYI